MESFLEANIFKTKTFVLYGNLKDTIWCPDLMPRDIEHYLVRLLKSRGYRHVVFYGEAGTKGAYCLDEESARFFFSANMNIPLPAVRAEVLEEEGEQPEQHRQEPVTGQEQPEEEGTGSQVADALQELFEDVEEDEYRPGDISAEEEEQPEPAPSSQPDSPAGASRPVVQRVRYAYRGQTMNEFLQKIHPLMLKKSSRMAVVFYNILTTEITNTALRDDILNIWEMNSKGNICLLLFPETLYNEVSLINKIRQSNLESKFLLHSAERGQEQMNPVSCVKICQPGEDEVKNMLRYLAIVGTEQGNKIRFRYRDIDRLAAHILAASQTNAARTNSGFEFMSEMFQRFSRFVDAQAHRQNGEANYLDENTINQMYGTPGMKPPDAAASQNTAGAPDWSVQRVAVKKTEAEEEKSLEELLEELDGLVGLEEVKEQVKTLISLQITNQWRREKGLPPSTPVLHMVFTGDPGTGKTTVARLLGKILRTIGVLTRGHLVEAGREDLVAHYVGQTAGKTRAVLERAKGGVLFIDEAYTLEKGGEQDFGREAIDTLLRYMENNREDFVVIVAGYPEKMRAFIKANEGLQSRFTKYVEFENYTTDQLMQILRSLCEKERYVADEAVLAKAEKIMKMGPKYGGRNFGNGRYVRNVYETAVSRLAVRVSGMENLTEEQATRFVPDDFVVPSNINADITELDEDKSVEELLRELDEMVGLQNVKVRIREVVSLQSYNRMRQEKGLPVRNQSLHMVFVGNPGTGKTVVARQLGKIYRALGILSQGQLVEVSREDLVGQYVGHTAIKTKEVLDSALGGILFVDEAYTLSSDSQNDFGQEAIDVLLRHMENSRGDLVVIVAGYPEEMKKFLRSNPGLNSRFAQIVEFDDYSTEELQTILCNMAQKEGYVLPEDAAQRAGVLIQKGKAAGGRDFGNGRFVRNMYESAIRKMATRMMEQEVTSPEQLTTFKPEDFALPESLRKAVPEQESTVEELLEELDSYIGLTEVKEQVRKTVALVKVNQLRTQRGIPPLSTSMHMVFTGNPGTGKTTVARLVGRIYKALGVLPSGHLVEVGREDLVGRYIGETAQKTREVLDSALGGVLFIDEAYALFQSISQDYGQEAIDTILRYMENNRDKLAVIVAGYPKEMERFIGSNPGLKSRFTHTIRFENYTVDELMAILELNCVQNGYQMTQAAKTKAAAILAQEMTQNSSNFGNGRVVRNLFEAAVMEQNSRISALAQPTDEELNTLTEMDFLMG